MNQARRTLVCGIAAVAGAGAMLAGESVAAAAIRPPLVAAGAPASPLAATVADSRRLNVHNLHTGDTLDAVYYENGAYVPDALAQAMLVLRDWRNGAEHFMDPRLFDTLHRIHAALEVQAPFQIISGYRSKQTNAMLHERSAGVASHSQHTLGKAVDVRIQGVELGALHKAALSVAAGGVGLYPVSDFVHVDVGPVRRWQGV